MNVSSAIKIVYELTVVGVCQSAPITLEEFASWYYSDDPKTQYVRDRVERVQEISAESRNRPQSQIFQDVINSMKKRTSKQVFKTLVDAGIYTKDGELTEQYKPN